MTQIPDVPPASTFVIRFWHEWSATEGRWRGRIEHVQSGRTAEFVELERMNGFLQALGVMTDYPTTPWKADE